MAKERLKTLLLLSMVCISIFLTKGLWISMPYDLLPSLKKEEAIGANYLLGDMIRPHKYLLNFSNEAHTIRYTDSNKYLWTSTRSILIDALSSNSAKFSTISHEDFLACNEKRSIVFYFPEEFNTYILSRSLNVTKPNDIVKKIEEIDSIYFYLGKGDSYFIFSKGEKHVKLSNLDIDTENIKERVKGIEKSENFNYYYPMKDTLGVNNDLLISFKMSKDMPKVYVESELNTNNIEEMRDIAEKFFNKDIDYIREIVEDSGSIIYLYDQQVLKIKPNGELEYFNPLNEPVLERNLYNSLNTAADFLSQNIGIPQNMYLAKIEKIKSEEDLGYRLSFRYRMGEFPIILGSDTIEDFVQIDVFNKNIRKYKRFIRKDMGLVREDSLENKNLLSAFDIINLNYNFLESKYMQENKIDFKSEESLNLKEDVLSSIKDINIAYVDLCTKDKGEELIGTWVLEFLDKLYAFDIYDGNLILEKDIK